MMEEQVKLSSEVIKIVCDIKICCQLERFRKDEELSEEFLNSIDRAWVKVSELLERSHTLTIEKDGWREESYKKMTSSFASLFASWAVITCGTIVHLRNDGPSLLLYGSLLMIALQAKSLLTIITCVSEIKRLKSMIEPLEFYRLNLSRLIVMLNTPNLEAIIKQCDLLTQG